MHTAVVAYITKKLSFIARACAHASVICFFVAGTVCSSGLTVRESKGRPNPVLDRLHKNQDSTRKHLGDVEKNLIAALQSDPDAMVRQGAAQSLGNYVQNPLVVRALAGALDSEKEKSVRYACALSLGLSPTFKAITALEKASTDPDADLRRQIAYSLQRHKVGANKVKATALLKKLSKDADSSVRIAAGGRP